jgi:hypothetical protein
MTYLEFLLSSARFWMLLVSLFLGAGLSRLAIIAISRKAKKEGHRRRVTAFFVLLAAAVACFTLGIFMPPSFEILSARVLVFGGAAAGASLVFFGLLRYLAAPVVLIVAIAWVIAIYMNAPWQPVRTEVDLVRVRIIGLDEGEFSAEVFAAASENEPWVIDGSGTAVAPVVEFVEYHPAYFLLGRRTAARLAGIVSFERDSATASWTVRQEFDPEGHFSKVGESVRALAERAVEALPGVSRTLVPDEPGRIRLLDTYLVTVQPDGDVAFEPVE